MGMFDLVKAPPITCDCGAEVARWQSKSGPCDLGYIEPDCVDNYYSVCSECGMWHEFTRAKPEPLPPFVHKKIPRTTP